MNNELMLITKADLKRIEKVSPRVSKKYVPIFTSELVETLAPEFKFMGGKQFVKGCSKHYIDLVNDAGDIIRIYNSYDRSLALRVSLVSNGIGIDLGVDRLIHIGHKAKEFAQDLSEAKGDIIKGISTAKKILTHLASTKVTEQLAKEISDVIFNRQLKQEGHQSYRNFVDVLIEKNISVKRYIEMSVDNFIIGEYTYTINGVKRNGRRINSTLRKVSIENEILDFLEERFPEYFL